MDELLVKWYIPYNDFTGGGGVAFYKSPQIWRINHYRFFHLPTDRSGFYTYIKDGESVWCPTNEPCREKPEKWSATHGMGYTRFVNPRKMA